jgi:hypothetical protein
MLPHAVCRLRVPALITQSPVASGRTRKRRDVSGITSKVAESATHPEAQHHCRKRRRVSVAPLLSFHYSCPENSKIRQFPRPYRGRLKTRLSTTHALAPARTLRGCGSSTKVAKSATPSIRLTKVAAGWRDRASRQLGLTGLGRGAVCATEIQNWRVSPPQQLTVTKRILALAPCATGSATSVQRT